MAIPLFPRAPHAKIQFDNLRRPHWRSGRVSEGRIRDPGGLLPSFTLAYAMAPGSRPPASVAFMASVSPVPPMHEEMKDRAQEENRIGKDTQDVLLVVIPEEQSGSRHEPQQTNQGTFSHRRHLRIVSYGNSRRWKKHKTCQARHCQLPLFYRML